MNVTFGILNSTTLIELSHSKAGGGRETTFKISILGICIGGLSNPGGILRRAGGSRGDKLKPAVFGETGLFHSLNGEDRGNTPRTNGIRVSSESRGL